MKNYNTGVLYSKPSECLNGYTSIAPIRHEEAYLVDMSGEVVHSWNLGGLLGAKAYLIPNGNLLCCLYTNEGAPIKAAKGGRILELDWDGNVVWEHLDHNQHHDVTRLENGNTLYIAWEELSQQEAIRVRGGVLGTEREGKIYGDVIREVNPVGEIVWEWFFKNEGYDEYALSEDCDRAEWAHANAVSTTLDGDILVSFRHLDTILVVDRETKKVKWKHHDKSWGHQHNCQMLPNGNITFIANGMNNLVQPLHSRAVEFDTKKREVVWQFKDPRQWTFFTPIMGSVQRLENGNTLICEALNGRVFEVNTNDEIVWDYVAPMHHYNEIFDSESNAMFRAYRYTPGSPEIRSRL